MENVIKTFTDFKKEKKQTELHPSHLVKIELTIHPFLLNNRQSIHTSLKNDLTEKKKDDFTIGLSQLSFCPVSFRYEAMNGDIPSTFATTSTRWGFLKSFVRLALLRAGREAIQSRVSANFSRLMLILVIEKLSKLSKTLEAATIVWINGNQSSDSR